MSSFSSMLILGTGRDAEHVAKHIASRRSNGRRSEREGSGAPASTAERIAA